MSRSTRPSAPRFPLCIDGEGMEVTPDARRPVCVPSVPVILCALFCWTVLAGCGSGPAPEPLHVEVPEGCSPLIPGECLLPYPSLAQQQADPDSPTGFRVALTGAMIPWPEKEPGARAAFLERFNRDDGFPAGTPLLALFPSVHVDSSRLPDPDRLSESVLPGSPVQLFDRQTGERLPVWAETDERARDTTGEWNDARRVVIIRPQRALEPGRRYAVAVTDTALDADGTPLPPSPVVQALLTGRPTDSPEAEALRPAYAELALFLTDRGLPPERIALAWEFVTRSRESSEAELRSVVMAARARARTTFAHQRTCLAADPAASVPDGCTPTDQLHPSIWRRVAGTFRVPGFLDPDGLIVWRDGEPEPQADIDIPFVAALPASARKAATGSVPLLQIGHGLMSSAGLYLMTKEDQNGSMRLADRLTALAAGADLPGLCTSDLGLVVRMIDDFDRMWRLHDRLLQGMAAWDLLIPFVRTTLASDPAFADASGRPLLDPARAHYFGISLGGIAGVPLALNSPDIRTAVMHAGSAQFSSLFQHSAEFEPFQLMLESKHPDPLEQQVLLALAQRTLDPLDPTAWQQRIVGSGKSLLWQIARHDTNAPEFGAYALARAAGIPLVYPTPFEPWGMVGRVACPSPPGTTGIAIYETGREPPGYRNTDLDDNGAHFVLRCAPEAIEQVAAYFEAGREGTIVSPCGAEACLIESGECRTDVTGGGNDERARTD